MKYKKSSEESKERLKAGWTGAKGTPTTVRFLSSLWACPAILHPPSPTAVKTQCGSGIGQWGRRAGRQKDRWAEAGVGSEGQGEQAGLKLILLTLPPG